MTTIRRTKLEALKQAYDRTAHGGEHEGPELHCARRLTRIAVMLLRYEAGGSLHPLLILLLLLHFLLLLLLLLLQNKHSN